MCVCVFNLSKKQNLFFITCLNLLFSDYQMTMSTVNENLDGTETVRQRLSLDTPR